MGRHATRYDNAVFESFFATYKKELIHTRPWNDLTDVRQQTVLWIESYHNRRRRHSTLNYLTPVVVSCAAWPGGWGSPLAGELGSGVQPPQRGSIRERRTVWRRRRWVGGCGRYAAGIG